MSHTIPTKIRKPPIPADVDPPTAAKRIPIIMVSTANSNYFLSLLLVNSIVWTFSPSSTFAI